MTQKKKKRWVSGVLVLVLVLGGVLLGVCSYMLDYSLGYVQTERKSAVVQRERIRKECPWTVAWMDSIYGHHCVKDTFVTMPSGYKAHALYLYAPTHTPRTAVVVHGYKMRAEGMLHIAYLYNHDLGWNVILPDLYGHGQSEGDHIQMGWNDRCDVIRWAAVANGIFGKGTGTWLVIHGISMGAATTMDVSGEKTPDYVKCFVEDCGYTSVWNEFEAQLEDQFGLPAFPLMNCTSALCRLRYGWSFAEASPIRQVKNSTKPMLFIHGDSDDFVPSWMVHPLFEAKRQGRKTIFIAKGSAHAMAYRDHHEEYTQVVRDFLSQ